ncbi:hypothetical protein G6F16_004416 [Rhizopus arrhizus]|nr:hypothetical protein G6F23_002098 [Rhizopus arrhizus]KAG0767338.1 hypothetical protein G6F24_002873 [Rhizopus arrhizus]KAG0797737.1 hypothetical protein G6F21_000298 [Rhizopus arrhizus]KAG0800272.1 hypothetical protein G6F22_002395 [Rhizopus arrhizus]KAG0820288.1 hypothetical protein G6F20_000076 [Rhizopus arrhizus]
MTASLPMKKLCDIRRSINLTMRIQMATFAIFPTRLYTRHLLYYKNQTVKSDKDWDLPSPLDPASIQELNWCLRYNIMIQAQHISGIYNTIADMESRRTYFKNQWQIKSSVFEELNKIWGPFTIDLFADRTTKLLPRYVSWLPDPDTMGYR